VTFGRRKGSKRSDRRWIDPDGVEWASKFEWRVFERLRSDGYRIRKCTKSDTVTYNTPVKQGCCVECGSSRVVQVRTYTSDLYVVEDSPDTGNKGYLIECKGYFPGPKRKLFCAVAKQLTGVDLRIIFESNKQLKGTKSTPVEYIHKYAKNVLPGVWDGKTETVTWYEST
jgi:hypothetical protein